MAKKLKWTKGGYHRYVFTFGRNHTLESGESLANCYCIITSTTMKLARERMMRARSNKWANTYRTYEEAGVKEFGLVKVPFYLVKLNFDK